MFTRYIIKLIGAYICEQYNPNVSVLVDYKYTQGHDDYENFNYWYDYLYTASEKEDILKLTANNKKSDMSKWANILLANRHYIQ